MKKAACITSNSYYPIIFPKRIEIELSNACNLRCTYCPRKFLTNASGFMDLKLFKKLIDEASAYPSTIIVLHRRGESLLHPDFLAVCDYVKGKFHEIQLATNATLLCREKAEAIIRSLTFISFSIDTPEEFNKTRVPAAYASVEKKISDFLKINSGIIRTQVSMVRTDAVSKRETNEFKRLWAGRVDRIRIYEEHSKNGKFGSLAGNRGRRSPCTMPFYEILVYFDGKVGRCNHDWESKIMGNVSVSSIRKVWENKKYKDLRQQHIDLKISDAACKSCDSWYPEIAEQKTGEALEYER